MCDRNFIVVGVSRLPAGSGVTNQIQLTVATQTAIQRLNFAYLAPTVTKITGGTSCVANDPSLKDCPVAGGGTATITGSNFGACFLCFFDSHCCRLFVKFFFACATLNLIESCVEKHGWTWK
jgi:hypothetical protein